MKQGITGMHYGVVVYPYQITIIWRRDLFLKFSKWIGERANRLPLVNHLPRRHHALKKPCRAGAYLGGVPDHFIVHLGLWRPVYHVQMFH